MKRLLFFAGLLLSFTSYSQQPINAESIPAKIIYRDGVPIQCYNRDGLIVNVYFHELKEYGHYIVADIYIGNNSGQEFNFDPQNITATSYYRGATKFATILSSKEYLRRVKKKQNLNSALIGLAAGMSTGMNASNKTTSTITTSNGNLFDPNKETITVDTYDPNSSHRQRRENEREANSRKSEDDKDRKEIRSEYLKLNTLMDGDYVIGNINIVHQKFEKVTFTVPVNGQSFIFYITKDMLDSAK